MQLALLSTMLHGASTYLKKAKLCEFAEKLRPLLWLQVFGEATKLLQQLHKVMPLLRLHIIASCRDALQCLLESV